MNAFHKILISAFFCLQLTAFSSCNRVTETANKGGAAVGRVAGEIAKGVGTGVDESFEIKIEVSQPLKDKGLELGRIILGNSGSGTDNQLKVYCIYHRDLEQQVMLKVFYKGSLEMGRSTAMLKGKSGEAGFVEFNFDEATNIDYDSNTITMELLPNATDGKSGK